MTPDEAALFLHHAADHLLEKYYETTNTPEREEEAMEMGFAVGLLLVLAQKIDGKPFPSSGWARYNELLERDGNA